MFDYFSGTHLCVLEKNNKKDQLRLRAKIEGLEYSKGGPDNAIAVFKNDLYAFPNDNYAEVMKFSLDEGKWTKYFQYQTKQ